ncbi:MAG: BrnT family toxin [Candidatus Sulfotelmatobacter sp.]
MCKYIRWRYTWDQKKNRRNVALHGISFADAMRIFDGPTVERIDDRFDYGEKRIYAIGVVNGREITVIYADRKNEERRIISAWRSEPHQRRHYWQNLEAQ